jgi:3-oxoacyl-[acyl-carrier protein] reductase
VREFIASSNQHVHVASPEDVAQVIANLASDNSNLIIANEIILR